MVVKYDLPLPNHYAYLKHGIFVTTLRYSAGRYPGKYLKLVHPCVGKHQRCHPYNHWGKEQYDVVWTQNFRKLSDLRCCHVILENRLTDCSNN